MEFIYLIGKELKIQLKQLPIYLYMVIVVTFLFSQIIFPDKTTRLEPIPVSEYLYEHIYEEYKSEAREVYNVLSLMKTGSKKLSQNEKKEYEDILKWLNKDFTIQNSQLHIIIPHSDVLIKEKLNQLDILLGGDSFYSERILNYNISEYERKIYGQTKEENLQFILKHIISRITWDLKEGKYIKYSLIQVRQYKNITVDTQKAMENALIELKKLEKLENVTKTQIYNICKSLDEELGGNSVYNEKYLSINRNKTYEEAKEYFEQIKQAPDLLTNAYARDIADYMGVICGILTGCVTSFLMLRDEKYKMKSIILLSGYSTSKYIWSKVLAIWFLLIIPYLFFAVIVTIRYKEIALIYQYTIDFFAFFRYVILWIAPTLLYIIALTFFLSIVLKNYLLPIVISFIHTFISVSPIKGNYAWYRNIIRMNGVFPNEDYLIWKSSIESNRFFYILLSIFLIIGTILCFQKEDENYSRKILKRVNFIKIKKNCVQFPRLVSFLFYQCKINFGWNLVIAVIFPFLAPLFWGIESLENYQVIGMSEMFLPLSSIFLFLPVGAKLNSQEEFYMKDNKNFVILFLLQIGMAILINMIICFGFYKMLFVNGADFSFQTTYVSALLANVFIGLLANVLSHVIGDIRSGFLIATAYYLLEFVTKGSITGLCYLFRPLEQSGTGYEILIFMIICILLGGSYKRKEIRGERVS